MDRHQAAACSEVERQRVLGDCLAVAVCAVHDLDAVLLAKGQVDVVCAYGVAEDTFPRYGYKYIYDIFGTALNYAGSREDWHLQVGRLGESLSRQLACCAYHDAGIFYPCYYVVFACDGVVIDQCLVALWAEVYRLPGDVNGFQDHDDLVRI